MYVKHNKTKLHKSNQKPNKWKAITENIDCFRFES